MRRVKAARRRAGPRPRGHPARRRRLPARLLVLAAVLGLTGHLWMQGFHPRSPGAHGQMEHAGAHPVAVEHPVADTHRASTMVTGHRPHDEGDRFAGVIGGWNCSALTADGQVTTRPPRALTATPAVAAAVCTRVGSATQRPPSAGRAFSRSPADGVVLRL